MRDIELGIQPDGTHLEALTPLEQRCLSVLEEKGLGQAAALPAAALTAAVGLESGDRNEDHGKRHTRKLINHLIMTHRIPIICQAGAGGGYYLPGDEAEVARFYKTFHARAMTGLVKASRGRKAAFVEIITQLSLGFDDPAAQAAIERLRLTPDEDPVPAWVQLTTRLLDRLQADPQRYAAEIRELQRAYGDIFVPRDKVVELKKRTAEFQQLLAEIA
jgi:hypothetical protein